MTACGQVLEAISERLASQNIRAVSAYEEPVFTKKETPLVAVGVRKQELRSAGLSDYLGERYDPVRKDTVEVYGRELKLEISLDVYAPRGHGTSACERMAEAAVEALSGALPSGLRPETMRFEGTTWDKLYEMFVKRGTVCLTACFTAETDGAAPELRDYILKGVVRI